MKKFSNNKMNTKLFITSGSIFICFSILWLIHDFLWANCYTGELMDLTNYLYNSLYVYWSLYLLGFLFFFAVLLYLTINKIQNLQKNWSNKTKIFLIMVLIIVAIAFTFFVVSAIYGNREFVNLYLRYKYQDVGIIATKIKYSAWFGITVIVLMSIAFAFNIKTTK